MKVSHISKRVASIAIALAITFLANAAISYAARTDSDMNTIQTIRSGGTGSLPTDAPRPRSGGTGSLPTDAPRPRSGGTGSLPTDAPRP